LLPDYFGLKKKTPNFTAKFLLDFGLKSPETWDHPHDIIDTIDEINLGLITPRCTVHDQALPSW